MATSSSILLSPQTPSNTTQYKATQLWRKMVRGFRCGMPVTKHRVRMKVYEDCFTGAEAADWLKEYLVTSGLFQSIEMSQVINLLQKFIECNVIEELKGKESKNFEQDKHRLYRFVSRPGPLNFLEEEEAKDVPGTSQQDDSLCIANSFALRTEPPGATDSDPSLDVEHTSSSERVNVTCVKRGPKTFSVSNIVSPMTVAMLWKEHTLARLLQLIDLSSLDLVLDHSPIDGKTISDNVYYSVQQQLSQQQLEGSSSERDIGEDVPCWVRMAIKCLSNWPEGCPEELTGGLPLYQGFEQDVLQSIITYFQSNKDPIVPHKLYDLHMSIYPLVEGNSPRAAEALQLCSLMLSQPSRIRLHRVLRMIHKACRNTLLHLSVARHNQHVLLEQFSPLILRPQSGGITDEELGRRIRLVGHMADNYRQIFRIPSDLQKAVEWEIELVQTGEARLVDPLVPKFCERVSTEEYERQKTQTSEEHLVELLGSIVRDENMSSKVKKKKLKLYQKSYPELYIRHFPGTPQPIRNQLATNER